MSRTGDLDYLLVSNQRDCFLFRMATNGLTAKARANDSYKISVIFLFVSIDRYIAYITMGYKTRRF